MLALKTACIIITTTSLKRRLKASSRFARKKYATQKMERSGMFVLEDFFPQLCITLTKEPGIERERWQYLCGLMMQAEA